MSYLKCFASIALFLICTACSKEDAKLGSEELVQNNQILQEAPINEPVRLDVFKSPTCGCCGDWVEHVENSGITANVEDRNSLSDLKDKLQVPDQARSCHVGVSKEGYFFEGHVPAKYIKQFLSSPPDDALGLAVPGMPVGSPGMEMEDRFDPYAVMLIHKDGSTSVYAELKSYKEQF